jgi:uncharacterized protein (TIGR02246 family)
MRSPWVVAAIATVGLAGSALAQQASQSTRQQIERLHSAYAAYINKQDAGGIASLYTKDGVFVTTIGVVCTGPQQIEQDYQKLFKTLTNFHSEQQTIQVSLLGSNTAISLGDFQITWQGQNGPMKADGRYTAVDVRQAGAWKVRLLTAVRKPPPASGTPAAPPAQGR